MNLVLGTRIALYVQLALGIAQSPGVANDVPGLLHTHRTLAFIIPVLAFLAFGVRRYPADHSSHTGALRASRCTPRWAY